MIGSQLCAWFVVTSIFPFSYKPHIKNANFNVSHITFLHHYIIILGGTAYSCQNYKYCGGKIGWETIITITQAFTTRLSQLMLSFHFERSIITPKYEHPKINLNRIQKAHITFFSFKNLKNCISWYLICAVPVS